MTKSIYTVVTHVFFFFESANFISAEPVQDAPNNSKRQKNKHTQ